MQVAQADVEGGAAPALSRVVAGLVDGFQHGFKLVVGKPCGDERLVGISQDSLNKLNFTSHYVVLLQYFR